MPSSISTATEKALTFDLGSGWPIGFFGGNCQSVPNPVSLIEGHFAALVDGRVEP